MIEMYSMSQWTGSLVAAEDETSAPPSAVQLITSFLPAATATERFDQLLCYDWIPMLRDDVFTFYLRCWGQESRMRLRRLDISATSLHV